MMKRRSKNENPQSKTQFDRVCAKKCCLIKSNGVFFSLEKLNIGVRVGEPDTFLKKKNKNTFRVYFNLFLWFSFWCRSIGAKTIATKVHNIKN